MDRPTALDPDESGSLVDDLEGLTDAAGLAPIPFYAAAGADSGRFYLFYGLYYPADWSGPLERPRIDHPGDFEGALLVVSRGSGRVDAVVTQAHRLFYLWLPPQSPLRSSASHSAVSGLVPLSPTGRPLLFAEERGHGLYAWASGRWHPRGGGRYATGPAGVAPERLVRIELLPPPDRAPRPGEAGVPDAAVVVPAQIRRLEELGKFTRRDAGRAFAELPRGAEPPWLWADRRGGPLGEPGAILENPAALLEALLQVSRP